VGRSLPFHRTTDAETKPLPVTVRVKAGLPAATVPGESPLITGAGLGPAVMVKGNPSESSSGCGVNTVTRAVPGVAMSAAVIAAVSCVRLTNVVGRAAPFQRTTDEVTKFVPVTVRVKGAPPARALFGDRERTFGSPPPQVDASLEVISSTPRSHPLVKLTVTVVDGRVQPVVTSCCDPVVTSWVSVWPASSESVKTPGVTLYTLMLFRTRGAEENRKLRDVPLESAK
jgi:hypothetical protein